MNNRNEILEELDAAIDRMDMDGIDQSLEALSKKEPASIQPEDAALFAARIQTQYKEKCQVKKTSSTIKIAVVAAAVFAMGITVYAMTAQNFFTFDKGDRLVTVRTTESMDEQEARDLVERDNTDPLPEEAAAQADVEQYDFSTVEEAEKTLDMRILLPAAMPDMTLENATGHYTRFGESVRRSTCWLDYSDEEGRMFGVTVSREVAAPGTSVTGYTESDMDEGSMGSYVSANGTTYTTLTESDPSGENTAFIATVMIGEYEYALVFLGFDEAERLAIIDSADLSPYGA